MIVLRLSPRALSIQLLIGLSGILLGYIEYLILRPDPLVAELSLKQVWLPILILLVFTGLLEELIFRGVLQTNAVERLGRLGILYVAIVCTVLHLGYNSLLDIFFVFAVALLFGLLTFRTGSLLGVSLSHGLTNVALYLVFPFLLVTPTSQILPPSDIIFTDESNPVQAIPTPTQLNSPTPSLSKFPTISPTTIPIIASPHPDEIWSPDEETNSTQCGSHQNWVVYIIQIGENLELLSARYGVSIEELRLANCFEINDQLHPGQGMFVPFDLPAEPTPSPTRVYRSPLPSATATPSQRPKKKPGVVHTQTPTSLPTPTSTTPPVKPRNTPTLAPTQSPIELLTPTPTQAD
jgi:LysM repeat protein